MGWLDIDFGCSSSDADTRAAHQPGELPNLAQPNLVTNLHVTLYLDLLPPPYHFFPAFLLQGLRTEDGLFHLPVPLRHLPAAPGTRESGGAALICESYSCAEKTANFNLVC